MDSTVIRDQLTLFDIPSVESVKQWSPNVTPVRMLLNYLGVPFETQWLEYPNIKPTLQKISSIPPHMVDAAKGPSYTLPAILKGDVGVMERFKIFEYLSSQFPDQPVLNQTSEKYAKAIDEYLDEVLYPKLGFVLAFTQTILQDEFGTRDYFQEKKKAWSGVDSKLIQNQPEFVAQSVKDFVHEVRGFKGLKPILTKNGIDANQLESGKFLLTDDAPTFADFLLGGVLFWVEQVSSASNSLAKFDYMDAWTRTWYNEIGKYAM